MSEQELKSIVAAECVKRRTFAIISHPDAGKTTLTEKLLLYAGMLRTAGMVGSRKTNKATSSDWMGMEQERGISITASAMQFAYKDVVINVLDTPGHQDFSEDTYRTLTAADSAVMVIDSAKGVEAQTKKLFAVCKMRGIPILTFINKLDLPGREPLDLMAEVEALLGIEAVPVNWPVGQGKQFAGVYDRQKKDLIVFEKQSVGGSQRATARRISLTEARAQGLIEEQLAAELGEQIELLDHAGTQFSKEAFLQGKITPVFFGSALTNFGVEPFFDNFAELAPCPGPRKAYRDDNSETLIDPVDQPFSGYVFKIQANMDPRHRDSMGFIRVCSGRFERDLTVWHSRLEKQIRLSRSHSMFGGDRNTLDLAYPGDIVGVVNPGAFAIGDTISIKGGFKFQGLPKFPPEVVARIRPADVLRKKSFDKGMTQFQDEGFILVLKPWGLQSTESLVAAVGPLQFEVLQYRLREEYKVETKLENLPYKYGSWLVGSPAEFRPTSSSMLAEDSNGQIILLYSHEWEKGYILERNPNHKLVDFVQ